MITDFPVQHLIRFCGAFVFRQGQAARLEHRDLSIITGFRVKYIVVNILHRIFPGFLPLCLYFDHRHACQYDPRSLITVFRTKYRLKDMPLFHRPKGIFRVFIGQNIKFRTIGP